MNLRKFFNSYVEVIYKDGEKIMDFVEVYTTAIDAGEGHYYEIILKDRPQYLGLNEVEAEEIKTIKIIN